MSNMKRLRDLRSMPVEVYAEVTAFLDGRIFDLEKVDKHLSPGSAVQERLREKVKWYRQLKQVVDSMGGHYGYGKEGYKDRTEVAGSNEDKEDD